MSFWRAARRHWPASSSRHRECGPCWATASRKELGQKAADERVDLLGLVGGGHLARADRPDRLVGDDQRRPPYPCPRPQRRARSGSGPPSGWCRPRARPGVSPTQRIGRSWFLRAARTFRLTNASVSPKSLRRSLWPEDHVGDKSARSIGAETLAGEGPARLGVHVLGAQLDWEPSSAGPALSSAVNGGQTTMSTSFCLSAADDDLRTSATASDGGLVHLPVAGDHFLADAWKAGLAFQKRDTGQDLPLEKFEAGAAAGGAVGDLVGHLELLGGRGGVAAADHRDRPAGGRLGDGVAIARVAPANFSNSKTPGGPFQTMVFARRGSPRGRARSTSGRRPAPSSRRGCRRRRRPARVGGVGGELVGADVVDGKTSFTPRALAFAASSATIFAPSGRTGWRRSPCPPAPS